MNNLVDSKDDEINLIEIIQLLWKNKITIISTTLVASLFGLILSLNQTKSFDVSIPLEVGKKSAFIKFIPINDILKEHGLYVKDNNANGYSFDAQSILKMLINEFQDKEEIIDLINKNEYFAKLTQNMEVMEKNKLAISFANSFNITSKKVKSKSRTSISFKWHNVAEGNKLIEEALELSLINVKVTLVDYLNRIIFFINMKNKRQENQIENRIESFRKAIELIVDLPYISELNLIELQEKLNTLSSSVDISPSQLAGLSKTIESANPNEWISYNLSSAVSNSNSSLSLNVSIFAGLGMVASLIYILFLSFFRRFQKS